MLVSHLVYSELICANLQAETKEAVLVEMVGKIYEAKKISNKELQ